MNLDKVGMTRLPKRNPGGDDQFVTRNQVK